MNDVLIFTDLDGTLMEHETYSIKPAEEMLRELADRGLVPIFNSSKTRVEIERIQTKFELCAPFVCENGAAFFEHDSDSKTSCAKEFGPRRSAWLPDVQLIRHQLKVNFECFDDWSPTQVAQHTGLNEDEAALAKLREYSEPILWRDTSSQLIQFKDALSKINLHLVEGGRFQSIQGNFDKRSPIDWLRSERKYEHTTIVALGDSPNDAPMLEASHIAAIVKSAKSDKINPVNPNFTIRSTLPGPAGWAESMAKALEILDSKNTRTKEGN